MHTDLPHVQITVQAGQEQSNGGAGDESGDLKPYIKPQEYLSELRERGTHTAVPKEC